MESRELDLHSRTWSESLEEFIAFYNHALDLAGDSTGVQLTIIHGYGSSGEGGVLRNRLRIFLLRFADRLEFTLGEEVDGNQGCTFVTPLKYLPGNDELLAEAIRSYCERPRARSKVMGKFRRHSQPMVMQAIRSLEKQGRLRKHSKNGRMMYESE